MNNIRLRRRARREAALQGSPSNPSAPRSSSPPTPNIVQMYSAGMDNLPTRWDDPSNHAVSRCVLPLTSNSYKGSSGRVGVLGGSAQCTGAPYYAAMASIKAGADAAFVFCASEAAIPIKCYSPELIVVPVYNAGEFEEAKEDVTKSSVDGMEEDQKSYISGSSTLQTSDLDDDEQVYSPFADIIENKSVYVENHPEDGGTRTDAITDEQQRLVDNMVSSVTDMFDQLDVLIVGPGLGRCHLVLEATAKVILAAKERNMPLVIDADGLFLLVQEPYANLVAGYKGVVLTPNSDEVKRMIQTLGPHFDKLNGGEETSEDEMSGFERATEGAIIVKKGSRDVIFSTAMETNFQDRNLHVTRRSMLCEEEGGLKRSMGLGDILSGCIGTFVAWNRIMSREKLGRNLNPDDLILACWSACCITKRACRHAFLKKRRAMTTPDVLEEMGGAFDEMTGGSITWE